jgi:O-antigen/teichoic acid export membrane protein
MLSILYAKVTVSLIVISASIYYYKKSVDSKKKVSVSDFKLFMKMSVIANVVAGWAKQAEIWVALSFLTPINLGLLYLLQRIETYFFEMPSNALSEVALPFFSEVSEKKDKSIGYANLIIKFQFILNILESIFFVLVAPFFVLFLFPEYAGMTNYFIIVSISFLFNFSAVLARFVRSIERNDLLLNIALLNFVLILVLGILLIPQYGLLGVVLTFAIKRVLISLYSFFALKQIGYSFTFIPNKSDLMLFWKTFLSLISRFARFLRLK